MIRYKGGKVNWVDDIDSDIFSIVKVTSMIKELGYENPFMAYYYKKPNTNLDNGHTELAVDKDVCEMLMYVDKFKVIELYTDHFVNKKHVFIQEPLVLGTTSEPNEPDIGSSSEVEVDVGSENGSGSDSSSENGSDSSSGSDSEDSDYFLDEENLIDDVDVDMAEFKSHTDPDVEWVGCKETVVEETKVFDLEEVDHEDFDTGSDSDEDVRRKALRKVVRMNKAKFSKGETIWKENFFVGEQFATSKLVKEKVTRVSVEQRRQLWLKKNDKLRVRVVCKGQVPDFANNNMGTIVPVTCNPKGPTSKVQPKSISKKEKVTKPKESHGCPWVMQVSKLPNEDTWDVKTLEDIHKCLQTRIVTKCTVTFLSRKVEESIKPNPKIPLSAFKDQLQKKIK
nr:transposase, MuDR [Tanacetum cinerariifolium]